MVNQPQPIRPVVPPVIRAYNFDAFSNRVFSVRESFVDGAIIPRNGKVLIGGDKGLGKTISLTQMAFEMASGDPMFGLFDVPHPIRVMVFQKEIPSAYYQQRTDQVRRKYFRFNPDNLVIIDRDDIYDKIWLDTKSGVQYLHSLIDYYRPDVTMIDPVYLFHNSDEDKSQSVKTLLYPMDEAIVKYNTTFVLSHNFTKKSKDYRGNPIHQGPESFRGSGAWYHWADAALWMNQMAVGKNLLEMFCRHGVEDPPTCVMTLNRRTATFDAEIQNAPTNNAEVVVVQLLNRKPGGQDTFDSIIAELQKAAKIGPRQAMTAISACRTKNLIYYVGVGGGRQVRVLTPASRQWAI